MQRCGRVVACFWNICGYPHGTWRQINIPIGASVASFPGEAQQRNRSLLGSCALSSRRTGMLRLTVKASLSALAAMFECGGSKRYSLHTGCSRLHAHATHSHIHERRLMSTIRRRIRSTSMYVPRLAKRCKRRMLHIRGICTVGPVSDCLVGGLIRVRLLAGRVLTGSTQDLPRRGMSARSRKDILLMHLDRDERAPDGCGELIERQCRAWRHGSSCSGRAGEAIRSCHQPLTDRHRGEFVCMRWFVVTGLV